MMGGMNEFFIACSDIRDVFKHLPCELRKGKNLAKGGSGA